MREQKGKSTGSRVHAVPTTMNYTRALPGSFNSIYFQASLNTKCKVSLMRERKMGKKETHVSIIAQVDEHDDGSGSFLPDHRPQVSNGGVQRGLGSDVGVCLSAVALQRTLLTQLDPCNSGITHTHAHACKHARTHAQAHTHTHRHARARARTHTHTHTHACTHAHMRARAHTQVKQNALV